MVAGSRATLPTPAAVASGPAHLPDQAFAIPNGYGTTRIVLMAKDPQWLYAYWELTTDVERAARRQLSPQDVVGLQSVLRVHDVTGRDFPAQPAHRTFDLMLSGLAMNWFIPTDGPGREFLVELGWLTNTGRFLSLARSNRVTSPAAAPSTVVDPAWAVSDVAFQQLLAEVGYPRAGLPAGATPSSPPLPAASARRATARAAWCTVDTDVVVHGVAEPNATVRIQGQPVPVRPDGTFSLRAALPDGTQTITVDILGPGGRTVRTLTPVIHRTWLAGERPADPSAPSAPPSARPATTESQEPAL